MSATLKLDQIYRIFFKYFYYNRVTGTIDDTVLNYFVYKFIYVWERYY